MVADMAADMEAHMVADVEVEKVADKKKLRVPYLAKRRRVPNLARRRKVPNLMTELVWNRFNPSLTNLILGAKKPELGGNLETAHRCRGML